MIDSRHAQQGSFIIEAIISLVLFAVGLISLMSLTAQALNQVGQSKARNDASYVAGELLSQMWVSGTVDLTAWTARLQTVIPEATGTVRLANCDCLATSGSDVCPGAAASPVTITNNQPVTVCISWTDRRDSSYVRSYQFSTSITR